MNMLMAGTRNEFEKLLHLKKYKVLLILLFLFSIAAGLLGRFAKGYVGLSVANTPFAVLTVLAGLLLPLIISLLAADLFTAEQENGTIRAIITRPVSRISIFSSKVLAIAFYIALLLLVGMVASTISGIVFNGISIMSIAEVVQAYFVSVVPMLPFILFASAVSQLCRNSSSAVLLTIFGYIVAVAIGTVISRISPMLFTSYTGWYKLFIGAGVPIFSILNAFVLLAAYALIFFAAGAWVFEKKEY